MIIFNIGGGMKKCKYCNMVEGKFWDASMSQIEESMFEEVECEFGDEKLCPNCKNSTPNKSEKLN